MTEVRQELFGICAGCGIPAEECPTTFKQWHTSIIDIEELTDPSCQGYLTCPNSDCLGHLVERKLWCVACQKEGKYE